MNNNSDENILTGHKQVSLRQNETLDRVGKGELKVIQDKKGYRYSIEPFLLASFIKEAEPAEIIDLGSGSGIIPLLLSQQQITSTITGLEFQSSLVERSRRSVELNNLQDRIDIIHGDVRDLPAVLKRGCFDAVVSNPPYHRNQSGRLSERRERRLARHELSGELSDFLSAAKQLLKHGGRFYIIYLAERLAELLTAMRGLHLEPKRLRLIHARPGDQACMILVEGRKHGRPGLKVEAPLVIYQGEGRNYTAEVHDIYAGKAPSTLIR